MLVCLARILFRRRWSPIPFLGIVCIFLDELHACSFWKICTYIFLERPTCTFFICSWRIRLACFLSMLSSVLPPHPMVVFFSFFLSNLIISPLILRGWGRALFCSNQIKPRMREHGWAHGRGAGKSRPFMTVFLISTHDSSCLMLDACFCRDLHVVFSHWYRT